MHEKHKTTVPLLVGNEGVLVETDFVWEAFYLLLKRDPLVILMLPFWLLRGTAFTVQQITGRVAPDVEYLPYNSQLVQYLQEQHRIGRRLVLVTSLPLDYVRPISSHLELFDSVLSREDFLYSIDPEKTKHDRIGLAIDDYVYAGRGKEDIVFWNTGGAVLLNPDQETLQTVTQLSRIEHVIVSPKADFFEYIRAIRIHQWLKNMLVFVPLITAHQFGDPLLVLRAFLAFFAFGLCASGVYLFNDLLDIPVDRRHPRKCKRPFAAASISVKIGTLMIPVFTLAAFGLGFILATPFLYFLTGYLSTTIFYSMWLKKVVLVDVIALAFLYTIRILAGGAAVGIVPSFWLMSFSMFIFFSLALTKRCAELLHARSIDRDELDGRGYMVDDTNIVRNFGIVSGYMSVLVLALYINSDDVRLLYSHPQMIWLLCPLLLYWISRMWLITGRGRMHDDPLLFTIRDRVSQGIGVLGMFVLLLAA